MKKEKDTSISYFITKSKKQRFIEYKLDYCIDHILKIKFMKKMEKPIKYLQYEIFKHLMYIAILYKYRQQFYHFSHKSVLSLH